MYSPLFLLFLLSVLFNFCSAYKKVQTQISLYSQCNFDTSSLQFPTAVPVFNAFDNDGNIDESTIMKNAKILQKSGVKSVRVLSSEVGSDRLDVPKKMKVIKAWYNAKVTIGFPETIMCHVGDINLNTTNTLALYAAKRCDAISVTDILNYPLPSIRDYVNCVKEIADLVYPKPFFVADLLYPSILGDINSVKRFALLAKYIKNFRGYITGLARCAEIKAVNDLSPNKILISYSSVDTVGALAFCLNGTSTLIANVCPECITEIRQAFFKGDIATAVSIQERLNTFYIRALGLKQNPDELDRTFLGYNIEVVRRLIYNRFGLDLGYDSACNRLSAADISRIDDLCEEEAFSMYSNGDDEYSSTAEYYET